MGDSGDGPITTWQPRSAEVLGRYVMLDRLGEGGMGIVHRAYDPALHREVALKVLRVVGPKSAQDRLFREAQALARVTHPHVVTVYDVGAVGADVFVAMELIRGETLRAWLSRPREATEILEVCIAAGEGLAAAHAAGLVHRDFKPSNVMVGDDGRVRVLDFGLARPTGEVASAEPVSGDLLSSPITQDGAIVGTPQYMAPEQRRGEPADARTDQYSFCLVLREALDSTGGSSLPPSSTSTSATPPAHVVVDDPRDARKLPRVPRAVRAAIARGMSPDPAKRFPSMRELLREIAPQRSRVWLGIAAALGVLIAGGAIALASSSGGAHPCADVAAPFARMWSLPGREALHAGFVARGGPLAEQMWERAAALIDDWGTRWTDTRRSTCEATHVRGEQSADLLDRRLACLDDRRRELGGVLDSFAAADPDIALAAVKLVRGVDPVGGCGDTKALLDRPPVPPLQRAQIDDANREVDAIAALTHAKKTNVVDRARRAADTAKLLGYAPLEASARYQLGEAQVNTGAYEPAAAELETAALAADRARDDQLRAKAWLERMYVQGGMLDRGNDALATRDLANAALSRVSDPGTLAVDLELYTSDAYQALGNNAKALEIVDAVLANGPASMRNRSDDLRALALNRKALLLGALGHWPESLRFYTEAQQIYESVYGADHPLVAGVMSNEANVMFMTRSRYGEAEQLYRRALAIEEGAFGSDSPQAATYLNNIVNLFMREQRYADAEPYARRAVEIRTHKLPPDHPLTARAVMNLATIATHLGKGDEAEALFQRGLAMQVRSLPPGVYDFFYAHQLHAESLLELGRFAAASAEFADACARALKLQGEGASAPTECLGKWARAEALAGDPKGALEHADLALQWAIKGDDSIDQGLARWGRAEAFAALGRGAEAADEVTKATARLAADAQNPDAPRLSAQLATWLAAHPARR